jgi:hypothetical protein
MQRLSAPNRSMDARVKPEHDGDKYDKDSQKT